MAHILDYGPLPDKRLTAPLAQCGIAPILEDYSPSFRNAMHRHCIDMEYEALPTVAQRSADHNYLYSDLTHAYCAM